MAIILLHFCDDAGRQRYDSYLGAKLNTVYLRQDSRGPHPTAIVLLLRRLNTFQASSYQFPNSTTTVQLQFGNPKIIDYIYIYIYTHIYLHVLLDLVHYTSKTRVSFSKFIWSMYRVYVAMCLFVCLFVQHFFPLQFIQS